MFESKTKRGAIIFDGDNPQHRRRFFIFWQIFLLLLLCFALLAPFIHLAENYFQIWSFIALLVMILLLTSPLFKLLRRVLAVRVILLGVSFSIECFLFYSTAIRQPSTDLENFTMAIFAALILIQFRSLRR